MNLGSIKKSSAFGLATFLCSAFVGCNPVSDWVAQRNAFEIFTDQPGALEIEVGPEASPEPVNTELFSNTGAIQVGTANVTPGGGPVGTEHRVSVDLFNDFADQVVQVEAVLHSGSRGAEVFILVQDTAALGHWQLNITSNGLSDEERVDTVDFILYHDPVTP